MIRRKRRKIETPDIQMLEHSVGLDNGTFSDEWVADVQRRLDEAGVGKPPTKKEFFRPPILERKPLPQREFARSMSAFQLTFPPGAVYEVPYGQEVTWLTAT